MQPQRAGQIVQGYLGDNPLSETRIAIRDNHGWLFIKADDGFAINLDAVAYFNDEFVRFVNDWKMEISTKTYHLLRDYVHCKSKEVELKLNAPNQPESRTY